MVRSLGTEDKGLNTDSLKQSVKHASDAGDLAKKKKKLWKSRSSFFIITISPNTLPMQSKHTWIEKHTTKHYWNSVASLWKSREQKEANKEDLWKSFK